MVLIARFNKSTRLLNKFWPGSITQIDPCEDGVLRRSNVMKFLESCSANGLPPEELFLPDDLMEGTLHGLTRVAATIIALVKWAETSAPTCSHSFPDGGNVNPETLPSLRKRPRITAGAVDPLLVQPLVGSVHVSVGDLPSLGRRLPTFDLPLDTAGAEVPPQSTSPLARDQPMSHSKRSKSEKELFITNQSTPPSTKLISPLTKDIYLSAMDQSTSYESPANQSKICTGNRLSQLTNIQSGETSPGSMLSLPARIRLLSGFLPSRTRLLSLPTRPRLSSFPTKTRPLSSPTRARLLSLPTRARLISLQTRTRLLSLPIRTQFTAPPCERAKDEIFSPTKDTSIIPALWKQRTITTPRTGESLGSALKSYDAPDHLSTRHHAFVDTNLGKSMFSRSL